MSTQYFLSPGNPTPFGYDVSTQGDLIAAAVLAGWTDCTASWPPAPPAPTLAQQAVALLADGVQVTDSGTPADSGTYALDPQTLDFISTESLSLGSTGAFTDGTTVIEWPDAFGELHAFTAVEFKLFAGAVGAFVHACRKCVIGVTGATLPSNQITIT